MFFGETWKIETNNFFGEKCWFFFTKIHTWARISTTSRFTPMESLKFKIKDNKFKKIKEILHFGLDLVTKFLLGSTPLQLGRLWFTDRVLRHNLLLVCVNSYPEIPGNILEFSPKKSFFFIFCSYHQHWPQVRYTNRTYQSNPYICHQWSICSSYMSL